jgi:glycerol 3-phosphate dehydrogenase (quinone) subunit A (EC 1.1.5.3)
METMRGPHHRGALPRHHNREEIRIEAELVINAAGAWAGRIAALAGAHINILFSMGSLLITQDRIATRVINRLRRPSDADILVPGGTVSILGTTSIRVPSPDGCRPSVAEPTASSTTPAACCPFWSAPATFAPTPGASPWSPWDRPETTGRSAEVSPSSTTPPTGWTIS